MIKRFQLILISVLGFSSCGNDQTEMEKISRHRADSLFQMRIPALEARMDSICIQKMQFALQNKLDSIVLLRKSEIIKLQEGL